MNKSYKSIEFFFVGQNATEERNKYDNWKKHQKLQQQIKSIHTRV